MTDLLTKSIMVSGGLVTGSSRMNDGLLSALRSPLYSFLGYWVMFVNSAEMGKLRHLCVSAKSR